MVHIRGNFIGDSHTRRHTWSDTGKVAVKVLGLRSEAARVSWCVCGTCALGGGASAPAAGALASTLLVRTATAGRVMVLAVSVMRCYYASYTDTPLSPFPRTLYAVSGEGEKGDVHI